MGEIPTALQKVFPVRIFLTTMRDAILVQIDRARSFLEKAKSLQEVKEVIALAEAAAIYAKRVKASQQTVDFANVVHLRAERKLGEMLAAMPKNKGRPGPGRGKPPAKKVGGFNEEPTLDSIGISYKTSSRAQLLAKASDVDFEAALAVPEDREINRNRVVKDIKEKLQRESRDAKRSKAAEGHSINESIIVGSFVDQADKVADGSVHLIFTDPPYNRKASNLLQALIEFAADKLCEGGSLLCYVGHTQLPFALDAFRSRLRYWWTIACIHSGNATVMREYGINACWKAVLWFVKTTRHDNSVMVNDVMSGGQEKGFHEWQQSESEAAYWIEKLTPKDGLVCDPFLGSGTTAVAAQKLGRNWIGFEINEVTARIASGRLK